MEKERRIKKSRLPSMETPSEYASFALEIAGLLEAARRQAARAVNAVLTATYWEIGRRIVEFEQGGKQRAEYGEELLVRLSRDLTSRFGRGFGFINLHRMRAFFLAYPPTGISTTPSGRLPEAATGIAKILSTPSIESGGVFPSSVGE